MLSESLGEYVKDLLLSELILCHNGRPVCCPLVFMPLGTGGRSIHLGTPWTLSSLNSWFREAMCGHAWPLADRVPWDELPRGPGRATPCCTYWELRGRISVGPCATGRTGHPPSLTVSISPLGDTWVYWWGFPLHPWVCPLLIFHLVAADWPEL